MPAFNSGLGSVIPISVGPRHIIRVEQSLLDFPDQFGRRRSLLSILRKSIDWQARCHHEARSQTYNKLENHDFSRTRPTLIKNQTSLGQAGSKLVATDSPKTGPPVPIVF
jgi:hypothetical protein